jgi:hypothetical protein
MSEVTYVRGNGSFGPEDIAQLAAGLELALTNLGIKDRNDPTAILLAKLIIQLTIDGERDPTRLATRAMGLLPSALQLEQKRQPMTKRPSSGCRAVPNPPSATHANPRSYVRTWHKE